MIDIKHVDAFTRIPQSGNPAGVVLEAAHLTEQQMQLIARDMNLSETAFILPSLKAGADLRVRWFTPISEVSLCGHATVAGFHALAESKKMGMEKDGSYHFNVETASGILPIDITKENNLITVMFGLPLPKLERAGQHKTDLVRILDLRLGEFDSRLPILKDKYLFVAVRRLHTLFTLKPNFLLMAHFLATRRFEGLCVYTTETIDRNSVVHSRFFAPNQGINEDPVTGSAHGPLAVILFENGILEMQEDRHVFQAEQGDAIGRPGRIIVELQVKGSSPTAVKIGGSAVTVMEGKLLLQN